MRPGEAEYDYEMRGPHYPPSAGLSAAGPDALEIHKANLGYRLNTYRGMLNLARERAQVVMLDPAWRALSEEVIQHYETEIAWLKHELAQIAEAEQEAAICEQTMAVA